MSNLVIVAIPAADEPVWKVSSEKVPHMTLLFLGPLEEDDNVQRMADFIEHAVEVSEHGPFYATVDYRDELGDDKADVLFFKDNGSLKWVNSFRNQLLQQNDIRAEFEEMEAAGQQYPEWVPHLTLGYPDAPAKPLPNDYPIYSVCFDRIALWTSDFDGPEFRLEWPERDESSYPSLAYSDVGKKTVDKLLHAGTKTKKSPASKTLADVHKAGADHVNKQLSKINEKFTKKHPLAIQNGVLLKANHPVGNAYTKTIKDTLVAGLNKAADGTDISGTHPIKIVSPNQDPIVQLDWQPGSEEVQHAGVDDKDPSTDPLTYTATRDEHGMFIGLETLDEAQEEREEGEPYGPEDELEQSVLRGKQFVLTHASALDDPAIKDQIKAKLQDILEDVTTDDDGDYKLFGDPLVIAKLQSVLNDFYNAGVDKSVAYDALGEVFLEHYGVLGMKWGIHRSSRSGGSSGGSGGGRSRFGRRSKSAPEPIAPTASSKVPHGTKRKTKIDTQGGENHPAHADAIHVAKAQAKLKKSGAAALSNQELRDVATRVQLEQQVSMLTGHKGKQFVKRQLSNEGQNLARAGVRTGIKKGAMRVGAAALV